VQLEALKRRTPAVPGLTPARTGPLTPSFATSAADAPQTPPVAALQRAAELSAAPAPPEAGQRGPVDTAAAALAAHVRLRELTAALQRSDAERKKLSEALIASAGAVTPVVALPRVLSEACMG
jgi:hypothetical protein